MQKYESTIFEVLKITESDVYCNESTGWSLSNFRITPKIGEVWCIITKFGTFHLAFRIE